MTTNSLTSPTKDEPNHILVLNTALTRNEPVLITEDEYDLVQPEINFTFGASTESFSSWGRQKKLLVFLCSFSNTSWSNKLVYNSFLQLAY